MQKIVRRNSNGAGAAFEAQPFAGLTSRMSALLRARGVQTAAEAYAYLHPSLEQRHDPMLLHDMEQALRLLEKARAENKRFIVYGDYDVDGVCATAIVVQTLLQYGLRPPDYPTMYRIPDRHEEGYGLNENAVRELIGKADVLVTVDCGITSAAEVAVAKEAGLQVIVTDHHALPDTLPAADAVIDPLMPPYPFPGLCGAGVAYQLCRALLGEEAAQDCLDLAALATVADMVPLTDENRAIVAFGLKAIETTRRPGLRALYQVCGYRPPVRSEHIAFGLAPRLNACGRLQSALMAVRLLFEEDEEAAKLLAFEMNRLNQERKDEERLVLEGAEEQLKGMDLYRLRAIVISGPGYESGVVGLAAGRLAEKYGYPTVVLSEREDGWAVGSARSVPGVNIYTALKTCEDLFSRFGGHPQAAGMTLRTADIPAFRERLSEGVRAQLGPDGVLMPVLTYDDGLPLREVNEDTVKALQAMEPFGMGNPAPVFLERDVLLEAARPVGRELEHLKCELAQGETRRAGIAFRHGGIARLQPRSVDILYTPVRNEFRGQVTYECQVSKMIPHQVTIRRSEYAEAAAMLRDLQAAETADGMADAPPTPWPDTVPLSGTLIYCRCAETARAWQDRHPELDVRLAPDQAPDPSAFSVIAYGIGLNEIHAPYRTVIFADGSLTGRDAETAKALFPEADILFSPRSRALDEALKAFALTVDALRGLYVAMRQTPPTAGVDALCRATGLSAGAVLAGVRVLEENEQVSFDLATQAWAMKPLVKRHPEESPLYRLLHARKEEEPWHIPLTNP